MMMIFIIIIIINIEEKQRPLVREKHDNRKGKKRQEMARREYQNFRSVSSVS